MQAGLPPKHNEDLPPIVDMTREQIEEEVEKNYKKIRMEIVNLIHTELRASA